MSVLINDLKLLQNGNCYFSAFGELKQLSLFPFFKHFYCRFTLFARIILLENFYRQDQMHKIDCFSWTGNFDFSLAHIEYL